MFLRLYVTHCDCEKVRVGWPTLSEKKGNNYFVHPNLRNIINPFRRSQQGQTLDGGRVDSADSVQWENTEFESDNYTNVMVDGFLVGMISKCWRRRQK